MERNGAIAVLEIEGLPAAFACADAMLKTANVKIIGYEITSGGNGWICIKISGNVSAVQVAIDAGCAIANKVSNVSAKLITPRPHDGMKKMLLCNNKGSFFVVEEPLENEKCEVGNAIKKKEITKSKGSTQSTRRKNKKISTSKQNGKAPGPTSKQQVKKEESIADITEEKEMLKEELKGDTPTDFKEEKVKEEISFEVSESSEENEEISFNENETKNEDSEEQ